MRQTLAFSARVPYNTEGRQCSQREMQILKELRYAVRRTVPILFTYLFIGVAFGMMMSDAGYGVLPTVLSALFIYAGSMQIVMVPMLAAGAPLWTLALTAFTVNARHVFYGIGFIERFRQMGWRRPYMIFALTDETYSALCSARYDDGLDESRAAFLIALFDHLYWVAGCFAGACAGRLLPFDMAGIEFSATAFFLVVVIEQWRQYRAKLPFLTAAVAALGFLLLLGPDAFLLPTLAACLLGLLLLRRPVERKEADGHE